MTFDLELFASLIGVVRRGLKIKIIGQGLAKMITLSGLSSVLNRGQFFWLFK